MLYDTLVAASRRDDALDDVRSTALRSGYRLIGLLERQREARREELTRQLLPEAEGAEPPGAAVQREIDGYLAACTDEEGRAAALCLVLAACLDDLGLWHYRSETERLLSSVRGWNSGEVAVMLRRVTEYDMGFWFGESLAQVLNAAEQLDAEGRRAVEPWLRRAHAELMTTDLHATRRTPLAKRLRSLLERIDASRVPEGLVPANTPWAAPLLQRSTTSPTRELADFVRHLARLTGPRPSQRWQRMCVALTDAASARPLVAGILHRLAEDGPDLHHLVQQNDGDLARGVLWAGALTGGPDAVRPLRALAQRTAHSALENLKLAGAAINALAEIDEPAALEALRALQSSVTNRALRKQLATALMTAAGKQGITAAQLVERNVPHHGLAADGSAEHLVGDYRARVAIEDAATVRIAFTGSDGRTTRTAPAVVKDAYPDEFRRLKALAKEIRGTLSRERHRLEALMADEREWPYEEWCRHYRAHPVTGSLVRGLIWEFQDANGVWHATAPGAEPSGEPRGVRLWHPVRATTEEVEAWRTRIVAERLRQPFKQAFREIYLLTPAEEHSGVHSGRFAAHIVNYQQLYALFKARGWQANYLGRHEGGLEGTARGEFGDGGWRACFHHEPAADDGRGDAPAHATTGQVRFERRESRHWRKVPVTEVPPLVFSEAMRDVDLFVVTSVAADPSGPTMA